MWAWACRRAASVCSKARYREREEEGAFDWWCWNGWGNRLPRASIKPVRDEGRRRPG